MLLDRNYNQKVINAAFTRVRALSREDKLKKVQRVKSEKTTFVTTYDPRLPNVGSLIQKHYQTLTLDPHMKSVFGAGMVAAHKRYRNVRDLLCRAKLYGPPVSKRPQRSAKRGWRRCKTCTTCKHSENKFQFISKATGENLVISQNINCKDKRIIYVIECRRCKVQYIGKTIPMEKPFL